MDTSRLLGNFKVAAMAQGLSLILSLFISFVVPKVLGVEQFGYWQLFIFYTSYVGFFMFGVNDGIYLVDGGKELRELHAASIASQFVCSMVLQVVFAVCLGCVGVLCVDSQSRSFVLFATAAYMVISNATGFFGYVFQAVNKTQWFSLSTILDKAIFFVPLAVLVLLRVDRFEPYVVCYLTSRCFALLYCAYKGRFLFREGLLPALPALRQTLASARVGIKLMIANIAGMLILGIARFAIDAAWGIATFGQFSYALTLNNFFLVFVAQLAMVLFPALRQANLDEQKTFFVRLRDALSLGLPCVYVLYFPLCLIVEWWLPAYQSALMYLGFVLPISVFDSKMNLVGTTYFKVLRLERELLLINTVTVALSSMGVFIGVFLVESMKFVLVWIVIAIACRSVYSEHRISAALSIPGSKLWIAEVAITALFVLSNLTGSVQVSFVMTATAVLGYCLSNRERLRKLLSRAQSRNK